MVFLHRKLPSAFEKIRSHVLVNSHITTRYNLAASGRLITVSSIPCLLYPV